MTDKINSIDVQNIHNYIKNIKDNNYIKDIFKNNSIEDKVKKLCPDNYVGDIILNPKQDKFNLWFHPVLRFKNKAQIDIINKTLPENNKDVSSQNVVIILESPHIEEYELDFFINPALGVTGLNLHKYFDSTFKNSIEYQKTQVFHIYLMNAIQYPTSLLTSPINTSLRNKIFKSLWNEESNNIKNNFIKRLTTLNPGILINACTGGKDKYGLRTLVENSIEEQLNTSKSSNNIKYYRSLHPSSPLFSNQTSFEFI